MKLAKQAACVGMALALNGVAFFGFAAIPAHPAQAADASAQTIDLLAQASGLTTRQVRMVIGNPTAFMEYRASYDRVDRQFRLAIGEAAYQHLRNDGQLTARDAQHLIALVSARTGQRFASK